MRLSFTPQQSQDFRNHMINSGMRQSYSGMFPEINSLNDPEEYETKLIFDTNGVFCIKLTARTSQLNKIEILMNLWGNFERGIFLKKQMPFGELLYSALYYCSEIYANSVRIIPEYEFDESVPYLMDENRWLFESDDDY